MKNITNQTTLIFKIFEVNINIQLGTKKTNPHETDIEKAINQNQF